MEILCIIVGIAMLWKFAETDIERFDNWLRERHIKKIRRLREKEWGRKLNKKETFRLENFRELNFPEDDGELE